MAVRLRLENGKPKEFLTWSSVNSGEGNTVEYRTKCGILWKNKPDDLAGCNHIDCAINACGGGIVSGIMIAAFSMGFAAFGVKVCFQEAGYYPAVVMLIPFIFSVVFSSLILSSSYESEKVKRELYEIRDHGTIHGIKAQLVVGDFPSNDQGYL